MPSERSVIQIRNVPISVHRRLKARAATEGVSMSEFILREIRKALEHPTRQEIIDRLGRQATLTLRRDVADYVREERDSR